MPKTLFRTLLVLTLLAVSLSATPALAQFGQGGLPVIPFSTSTFLDARGSREGEILAKIRFSYNLEEGADEGELCVALGIKPDPRAILKGYVSFMRVVLDENGKKRNQRVKIKLSGKAVKQDGIEFWDECQAHVIPSANDQIQVVVRRPREEPEYIPSPYPNLDQYRWVTLTRLPNGGFSWSYETTTDDGSDADDDSDA